MRFRRRGLALAAVLVCLAGAAAWWWPRPARTNLLIVTLDTTRADRVGAFGSRRGLTPVLDKLAAQGIVFERAYAPVPITLPSHTSMFTGLYPPEHGLRVNNGLNGLGSQVPLLSELLQQQGYRTGAFLGAFVLDHKFGLNRGFDVYDDTMEGAHGPGAGDPHSHRMRIGEHVVDAALRWLDKNRRRPFYCWVHLFDPHLPYRPRPELFGDRFRDEPYDAGIAYVDVQVKRLLDFLKQHGLDERTVVLVVGDHGESLGEHQERTHGFTVYDATLHVPMMIRLPEPAVAPRRIATPVSLVDVFPTLTELFGLEPSGASSGRSLVAACRGRGLPEMPLYAESNYPFEEGGASPLRCLITERLKYIRSPKKELYDLDADAGEVNNIAEQRADDVVRLEQVLQTLEARFVQHEAPSVVMSAHEKRTLASLGYTAGHHAADPEAETLPDIKDLLPHLNAYQDAQGLMARGEFAEAEAILLKVVAAVPRYFQAWYNLGVCAQQRDDIPAAEQAFVAAARIDPNATAQIAVGKIYLRQNRARDAIKPLQDAVASQPDLAEGSYWLGEAYRMLGKTEDARRMYLQAWETDPEFQPAREALRSLPAETETVKGGVKE